MRIGVPIVARQRYGALRARFGGMLAQIFYMYIHLPAGSMVKFYFGGEHSPFTGLPAITQGLPPTPPSLDAMLGMMRGSALPWAVGAFGGDIGRSSVLPYALELGGLVRLGLEDFAGDRTPSNVESIEEVAVLAGHAGRRLATSSEAAEMLGIPVRPSAK